MKRRIAIKQIGLLAGGFTLIPYGCDISSELEYSNLKTKKKRKQNLIGQICNIILPEDSFNFPTQESRQEFVLIMINNCYTEAEIIKFISGFEFFKNLSSETNNIEFEKLSENNQISFIDTQFNSNSPSLFFLDTLKKYSLLHFESSENYMSNYLNFEFIPGRYLGNVII